MAKGVVVTTCLKVVKVERAVSPRQLPLAYGNCFGADLLPPLHNDINTTSVINIITSMTRRENVIASSITDAIVHSLAKRPTFLARVPSFFWLYYLRFECLSEELFRALRNETWRLRETEYEASFGAEDEQKKLLKAIKGDMGMSGSTFYMLDPYRHSYLLRRADQLTKDDG